ncbi:MAG TPA: RdgB/HAM1 family non-canonical purine NTP pyrophosphatase [Burkholderiales bacterium]|nr:RdgB/HAM1 family non-canonical purine NTP pyrophosphatase [Burkholderiales bacterium]
MKELILASNNKGKIKEFTEIFNKIGVKIIPQKSLNIPEVDEPYNTFIENSLHKARHCSKHTKLPALADDSGLCVLKLNGAPGIYSARYAGYNSNNITNNQKLINELYKSGVDFKSNLNDQKAYFYCTLVLIRYELDPQPLIADGFLNGIIIEKANGDNGFGYDPHFFLPDYKKTLAQLEPSIKNQISHRGMAIENLLTKIKILNLF